LIDRPCGGTGNMSRNVATCVQGVDFYENYPRQVANRIKPVKNNKGGEHVTENLGKKKAIK
jgi:hypothetical protein